MGTARFAASPPPSSRAAAPASSPFVRSAPRACGGARPCGDTGARGAACKAGGPAGSSARALGRRGAAQPPP